tara:strand:- start:274 stop:393 length:120 start_codon:yes stop_codon:yes gene_type:complete
MPTKRFSRLSRISRAKLFYTWQMHKSANENNISGENYES